MINQNLIMRPDILTSSATYFDFVTPHTSVINVEDIAQGLAKACRFAGQCRTPDRKVTFYSVAQHSVLVSKVVPPEYAFYALFHDATEAYMCDIAAPLKQLLPDYKIIEKRVELAIFSRLAIPYPLPPEIKRADLVLLATEQRDLMPDHDDDWALIANISPLEEKIVPLPPEEAYELFMNRYEELLVV